MAKKILHTFWQILFKLLIVPSYKFFLFLFKKINKYLIHNPYLTKQQIRTALLHNSPAHLIILIISSFVISSNFTTREIYANELNKNSIAAQLFSADNSLDIIVKSSKISKTNPYHKTESILNELSAIESNNHLNQKNRIELSPDKIVISQTNNAIINSVTLPSINQPTAVTPTNNYITKKIQTYIIQNGDTLSTIAKKFNLSINTILWENNLSLNDYIRPNDKLKILPTNGITYTVRSGDTLSSIIQRYGSTVAKILAYNNLSSASKIKNHQQLILPDGKSSYRIPTPTKTIYASKKPAATTSKGNFIWPTSSRRITQYYHWGHHAIDIAANKGTPIYAAKSGRIERSGWSTGYGYNIVINHGGGVKTLYGHASKLYVKRGEQVTQGEVIGAVGSTGHSTGPHIHFEIRINRGKVNPLSYL